MDSVGSAPRKRMTRLAAASSIGTTLEWYDFIVYNLMAALVFNKIFFPSFDPLSGTLLAFSTYAIGYLSRPIGGIVFGHLGDRRGRRFVLVATLLLMGFTTCLISVLPSYLHWGVWSPVQYWSYCDSVRALQSAANGQVQCYCRSSMVLTAAARFQRIVRSNRTRLRDVVGNGDRRDRQSTADAGQL